MSVEIRNQSLESSLPLVNEVPSTNPRLFFGLALGVLGCGLIYLLAIPVKNIWPYAYDVLRNRGPIPIIERFYSSAKFVNIFRSIFTAVSLWMIYLIYRDNRKISDTGLDGGGR